MSKWKKIIKGIEDSFTASAFAEAGEFETARSIIEESKGWIVLAGQGSEISKKICSYVKRLCESTKSGLQIIWKGSLSLMDVKKRLEGIPFKVAFVSKSLEDEIPIYLRHLHRISMVVLTGKKKKFKALFNKLSLEFVCPLVVISEKEIKE